MQIGKQLKRESRKCLRGARIKACGLLGIILVFKAICTFLEELASVLLQISYFRDTNATPKNYLDNSLSLSPVIALIFLGGLLLHLLLVSPFSLGQKSWYQHLAAENPAPLRDAFRFYKGWRPYWRAVIFSFRLSTKRFFLACFCFLPLILLFLAIPFLSRFSVPKELFWILLSLTFVILFLACTAVAAYWLGRYFLAEYILVLFSCKIRDAFRLSAVIMRGRKNEWLSLLVSMLPYYLADLLVLPLLFTVPYRNAVYARYARYFMESYEKSKETAAVPDSEIEFATREFSCVS